MGWSVICDLLLLLLQLLIGFECGVVVLWDLKCKKADYRYNYDEVSCYFPPLSSCEVNSSSVPVFSLFWLPENVWLWNVLLRVTKQQPKYFLMHPESADHCNPWRFCPMDFLFSTSVYSLENCAVMLGLIFNRFRLTSSVSKEVITFRNSRYHLNTVTE